MAGLLQHITSIEQALFSAAASRYQVGDIAARRSGARWLTYRRPEEFSLKTECHAAARSPWSRAEPSSASIPRAIRVCSSRDQTTIPLQHHARCSWENFSAKKNHWCPTNCGVSASLALFTFLVNMTGPSVFLSSPTFAVHGHPQCEIFLSLRHVRPEHHFFHVRVLYHVG